MLRPWLTEVRESFTRGIPWVVIFHTSLAFDDLVRGVPVGISPPVLYEKKLEWCGYPVVKKFRRYLYSFWRNSRTWQTDRRTDGRTDTACRHIPRLCICIARKNIGKKHRDLTLSGRPYIYDMMMIKCIQFTCAWCWIRAHALWTQDLSIAGQSY